MEYKKSHSFSENATNYQKTTKKTEIKIQFITFIIYRTNK